MSSWSPTVLLLDGDFDNTLSVARELSEDLDATIIGVGSSQYSRLHQSVYCDEAVTAPPANHDDYPDAICDLTEHHRPDTILAVGFWSATALQSIRDDLPTDISLCIPEHEAFRTAIDKARTMAIGEQVGIDTPEDYTALVQELDADGRHTESLDALPFPVFLKARYENSRQATALVDSPETFWAKYDEVATRARNDEVLVQEYIDGTDVTYGCGVMFVDDALTNLYGHEEVRSVPRSGGSGTHLRIHRDPRLETISLRLLRALEWNGIALVEYKRRPDGTPVLMEINPKFWASYALASTNGYRFASTMVANTLDIDIQTNFNAPRPVGEMVFPLRELNYYVRNRNSEHLTECLASMIQPGRAWDIDPTDLRAYLTPPIDVIEKMPTTCIPDDPAPRAD